jgi:hypothetical protein
MDNLNLTQQGHSGTLSALTLITNVLIATHPDKARVISILKELSESDAAVLIAMLAPGKPAIDKAFRDTIEHAINAGAQSR